MLACFDVRQLLATQFGVADLSAGAVDCLVTVLVRDGTLADILREAVLQGTDPAVAAGRLTGSITDGLRRCLTPDELGRLRSARVDRLIRRGGVALVGRSARPGPQSVTPRRDDAGHG